jgi:hypothetical protein
LRVVGSPHFLSRSSTVESLETIQLPQRKVSAEAAKWRRSKQGARIGVLMGAV